MLLLLALVADPYPVAAVPDAELALHRGGFRLPTGIDVALTVDTQTAVDGAVVLRTVFRADQGTPTLATYVPRAGETVASGPAAAGPGGSATMPTVTYDRQGGIQVIGGVAAPGVSLNAQPGAIPAGLVQVGGDAIPGGGAVGERTEGAVRLVELSGADLTVTHVAGGAFGAAIANTGSDRVIDTRTSVSIDLSGAGPDVLGSAMLRVQDIAAQAVAGRL